MVVEKLSRSIKHEQDGSVLTEGLMVFPLMVFVVAICVEIGLMMTEWNQAAKAMYMGARKLAVSDPITADFNTVFAYNTALGGQPITADATKKSVCDNNPNNGIPNCNTAAMERLLYSNSRSNADAYSYKGLARHYKPLSQNGVYLRVTYELSGLGFHGRPRASNSPTSVVVSVRVELDRQATTLPILSGVFEFVGIRFPSFAATVSSEDLNSTPNS